MTEAALEAACRRHAHARGVRSMKVQGGVTGDPDRIFLLTLRRCWLVEFKSPGGRLSPRQRVVHAELAAAGHPVDVIRSTKQFKKMLDIKLQGTLD